MAINDNIIEFKQFGTLFNLILQLFLNKNIELQHKTVSILNRSRVSIIAEIDYLTAISSGINLNAELSVLAVDSLKIIIIKIY